jgi:hypothetical protein
MKVYFISGLGADSRVFSYLKLPSNIEPVFIEWLIPAKNESIQNYARRMSSTIDISQPFIIIGLSFGGILASEMSQFLKPKKIILISSVAQRSELPIYYKIAGVLKLASLLPAKTASHPNFLTYWALGIHTENEKKLVKENFVANTGFSKWAIKEILNWKQSHPPKNVIRIHGNNDRLLPITNFSPEYIIEKGSHFMIVNKADEISEILAIELSSEIKQIPG